MPSAPRRYCGLSPDLRSLTPLDALSSPVPSNRDCATRNHPALQPGPHSRPQRTKIRSGRFSSRRSFVTQRKTREFFDLRERRLTLGEVLPVFFVDLENIEEGFQQRLQDLPNNLGGRQT